MFIFLLRHHERSRHWTLMDTTCRTKTVVRGWRLSKSN